MNERREGSMFFMRAVTVVGQGPFTLEAKVEDLVGHTTGTIQTPLRVGRNAPGLVATDALVVRPFKGSADKFEADQVLSYEGEALSPVLDPVFRADRPVDLQIYLRLYPDIHGSPLDLSMEVLSEGRVVARMALPFKGGLASSARDGASSMSGSREHRRRAGQGIPVSGEFEGRQIPRRRLPGHHFNPPGQERDPAGGRVQGSWKRRHGAGGDGEGAPGSGGGR